MNNGWPFYGWTIVAISAFCICFSLAGVVNYGFSSFVLPLSSAFGWNRAEVSFAYTISSACFTLAVPIVGVAVDRYGPRRVLSLATLLFAFMLSSLFFLQGSLTQLYISYALLGMIGTATSPLPYSRLVLNWFDRKKGLALALVLTGVGAAAIIIPLIVRMIIDLAGWRWAYLTLAAINLLICWPLILGGIRDRPEDKGTFPDGVPPLPGATPTELHGFAFRECIRSPAFWRLVVVAAIISIANIGPTSHLIPILSELGGRSGGWWSSSLLGFALIVGRVSGGYLLDRYHARAIASAFLAVPALGLASLAIWPGTITGAIGAVSIGLALGAEFDVLPFFCVQYFGRYDYGKTYAAVIASFTIFGGLAAFLLGAGYDRLHSYVPLLLICSGLSLIGAMLLLGIGRIPELPQQSATDRVWGR